MFQINHTRVGKDTEMRIFSNSGGIESFWPASRFICSKATRAFVASAEVVTAQIKDIWSNMLEKASPTAYIYIYVWFAVVTRLL